MIHFPLRQRVSPQDVKVTRYFFVIVAVFMFDIVVVVVFNSLDEMKIGNGRRVKQRDEGDYEVEELRTEKDRRKGSKGKRRKTEREREREGRERERGQRERERERERGRERERERGQRD